MKAAKQINEKRARRNRRVRAKIFGVKDAPRLAVFRSNQYIAAQLIDDGRHATIAAASSRELPKEDRKKTKTEQAASVGLLVAKRAKELGVTRARFDRRSYRYHGRVSALAEGARKGGLSL